MSESDIQNSLNSFWGKIKGRSIDKKKRMIEERKLDIELAKLDKQLEEAKK